MKTIGILSTVGGQGSTTISIDLAKILDKSLLCEFNNGFRELDLLTGCENEIVYDLYDFVEGVDSKKCIVKSHIDFIASSQTKLNEDIDLNRLKDRLSELDYEYIIFDIQTKIRDIKLLEMCDEVIFILEDSSRSFRNFDKYMFSFMKAKIRKNVNVVFNKLVDDFEDSKYNFDNNVKIISKIYNSDQKEYFSECIEKIKAFITEGKIEFVKFEKLKNDDKKSLFDKFFRR